MLRNTSTLQELISGVLITPTLFYFSLLLSMILVVAKVPQRNRTNRMNICEEICWTGLHHEKLSNPPPHLTHTMAFCKLEIGRNQ